MNIASDVLPLENRREIAVIRFSKTSPLVKMLLNNEDTNSVQDTNNDEENDQKMNDPIPEKQFDDEKLSPSPLLKKSFASIRISWFIKKYFILTVTN